MKPYVKRQKNDATDAEAICEAAIAAAQYGLPMTAGCADVNIAVRDFIRDIIAYSITSTARRRRPFGISCPISFAVFRLTTSSNRKLEHDPT